MVDHRRQQPPACSQHGAINASNSTHFSPKISQIVQMRFADVFLIVRNANA